MTSIKLKSTMRMSADKNAGLLAEQYSSPRYNVPSKPSGLALFVRHKYVYIHHINQRVELFNEWGGWRRTGDTEQNQPWTS